MKNDNDILERVFGVKDETKKFRSNRGGHNDQRIIFEIRGRLRWETLYIHPFTYSLDININMINIILN